MPINKGNALEYAIKTKLTYDFLCEYVYIIKS